MNRSFLFVPADNPRRVARALGAGADAVILDLEDAVAAEARGVARQHLRAVFEEPAGTRRLIRVNAVGTEDFQADLALAKELAFDGIVLPKATAGSLADLAGIGPLYPIIETARGIKDADAIAAHSSVERLLLGAVDLAAELRLERTSEGVELAAPRWTLALASALAAIPSPIDGVFVDVRDLEGLRRHLELGRSLGMGGALCIHPDQIAVANEVFGGDPAELEWARRVLEANSRHEAEAEGVFTLDGKMIDAAVVRHAQRVLSNHER